MVKETTSTTRITLDIHILRLQWPYRHIHFLILFYTSIWWIFHWRLSLKVIMATSQHRFIWRVEAEQPGSHYMNQWWSSWLTHIYISSIVMFIRVIRYLCAAFDNVIAHVKHTRTQQYLRDSLDNWRFHLGDRCQDTSSITVSLGFDLS